MMAEEGEDLSDLGIPRRQRGTRRRLNFDRVTHEPVYERPRSIERHTSGIYDLIDAIGLLGEQLLPLPAAGDAEKAGPACSEGALDRDCDVRDAGVAISVAVKPRPCSQASTVTAPTAMQCLSARTPSSLSIQDHSMPCMCRCAEHAAGSVG